MTRRPFAWVLTLILAAGGTGLWAQTGGAGQPGAAPALPRSLSGADQSQLEGQLVDLFTITQRSGALSGSGASGASGAGSTGTAEPGLKIERATPPAGGATVAPAGGASANSGAMQSSTSGGVSTHVGDSAGTYNNPGAVGGSGDTSAAISGSPRVGNTASGTTAGTAGIGGTAGAGVSGTASGASANAGATVAERTGPGVSEVRMNLSSGIPAALSSGGQTYVLVCDPRQLSQIAGNTVRVSGRVSGSNLLIPSKIEVRDAGGIYREVALALPVSNGRVGTASDR